MPEPLEKRLEKVEGDLVKLNRDLVFVGSLVGIMLAFLKNMHSIVDVHEIAGNQLIQNWYNEVNKQTTVADFLKDLKNKFTGGDGGHTPK